MLLHSATTPPASAVRATLGVACQHHHCAGHQSRAALAFLCSAEMVLMVCTICTSLLLLCEIQEVRWPMAFVVVFTRVFNAQAVLHCDIVFLTHEVVVPNAVVWHHEETQKDVAEQHLYLLRMCWQKACRVWPGVFVRLAPLKALWRDPVSRERATAWREAASNNDCLVCQPGFVICEHPSMECHILRAKVWLLVWLRVDPTERLKVSQMVMVWELLGQRHRAVSADLWHHDHTADLLHLRVIRG
mmetsp:Transcript_80169/g.158826  ORF Transcript_80169/g.158826 Transcript_80169/m.158826 type:complete len:245 (+) Transcript_80169:230-964(+)